MSKQETLTSEQYRSRYSRPAFKATKKSLKGRTKLSELPIRDSIDRGSDWCKITLVGITPGLNGKTGLLREHWSKRIKRKKELLLRIIGICSPYMPQFKGRVEIFFMNYASILSDDDNLSAKRKILYDCLANLNIIESDSPKHIIPSLPTQEKCRRKDQRVEITIKQI